MKSAGRGRRADDKFMSQAACESVREFRQRARLTQMELATRLGVSCRLVEKVEAGKVWNGSRCCWVNGVTLRSEVYSRLALWMASVS